jgi:uroporphyrinogen decarboxylase
MTRKERVKRVIARKPVDIVPLNVDFTLKAKSSLSKYYCIDNNEIEYFAGGHLTHASFHAPRDKSVHGVDIRLSEKGSFAVSGKMVDDKRFVDEFGVLWNNEDLIDTGDWGMIDYPVKNLDFSHYTFPNGKATGRFTGLEEEVDRFADCFHSLVMIGLFDIVWRVCGMQDTLMSMALEDKAILNSLLDKALEFNLGVIFQVPKYFDAIRFLEDWGTQKGLLMGIDKWRYFLKPRLQEMYEATKRRGFVVMSHSCGDIHELFPDLIEIGVDVCDPLQPEVMDIKKVKREYGKDLTLMGGLGSQSTFPLRNPEAVEKEMAETLSFMNEGGGYILGPAGALPAETPVANIVALVEAYKQLAGECL